MECIYTTMEFVSSVASKICIVENMGSNVHARIEMGAEDDTPVGLREHLTKVLIVRSHMLYFFYINFSSGHTCASDAKV